LVERQRCTIKDLAEAVKINPISVRHHIGKLETDGLVSSEDERHGVGRPRRVYFLTEKGIEQFPSRNIRLTSNLIGQLKKNLPPESVEGIFRQIGGNMGEDQNINLGNLSLDERLNLIDQRLRDEGFGVQIERRPNEILIHETSCPYFHVGQMHNEVCTIDQGLINSILETEAERTSCLLSGDSHCTYTIPLDMIQLDAIA
jgi:predicted ArsR family transcriptional regulator